MSGFQREYDPQLTYGNCMVDLFAIINTNGASPNIQYSNIPGVTVSHIATGQYRLQFPTVNGVLQIPANAATCLVGADIGTAASANLNCTYNKANLATSGYLDI